MSKFTRVNDRNDGSKKSKFTRVNAGGYDSNQTSEAASDAQGIESSEALADGGITEATDISLDDIEHETMLSQKPSPLCPIDETHGYLKLDKGHRASNKARQATNLSARDVYHCAQCNKLFGYTEYRQLAIVSGKTLP